MASALIGTVFFDLGDTLVIPSTGWIAGAKDAIAALQGKGIRLGIISNTGNLARDKVLDLLPADFKLSDFVAKLVLFSSEVGHEKPSKEIFQLAVTKSGADATTCLYVSENLLETLAAQQVGMRAARVDAGENDIKSLLQDLQATGLV
jgi:putative hydrolase of the HAD superfamily